MTTVVRPIHFAVKYRRKRLVVGPDVAQPKPAGRVPRVARLMVLAIKYDRLLWKGVVSDLSELARLCQVTQPRMTQIMNLINLAPEIQEEILFLPPVDNGRDPIHERALRPINACVIRIPADSRAHPRVWGGLRFGGADEMMWPLARRPHGRGRTHRWRP